MENLWFLKKETNLLQQIYYVALQRPIQFITKVQIFVSFLVSSTFVNFCINQEKGAETYLPAVIKADNRPVSEILNHPTLYLLQTLLTTSTFCSSSSLSRQDKNLYFNTIIFFWSPSGHIFLLSVLTTICISHFAASYQLRAKETVFSWLWCHKGPYQPGDNLQKKPSLLFGL